MLFALLLSSFLLFLLFLHGGGTVAGELAVEDDARARAVTQQLRVLMQEKRVELVAAPQVDGTLSTEREREREREREKEGGGGQHEWFSLW